MSMLQKKIIWTRAIDDLPFDRRFLSSDLVWCLPCINRFPTSGDLFDSLLNRPWDAAIFTSRYTATLVEHHPSLQQLLKACSFVFCLTPQIANYLSTQCGIKSTVLEASKNGSAFLQAILKANLLPEKASVLLVGAKEKAFDMKTPLESHSFFVQNLDLYETKHVLTDEEGNGLEGKEQQALREGKWIVCFASPSAVLGFVGGFPTSFKFDSFYDAVVIGPTTAAQAKQFFSHVHESEQTSVEAMHSLALQLIVRNDR